MFLIVLEYAILAATFTLAKKALSFSDPFFLIMVRLLTAGMLLTTFSFLKEWLKSGYRIHPLLQNIWHDRYLFLGVGLFHAYLAFIPEFWALQYVTSAKTSIIYAATPFVAALLSYFLHGERLVGRQWLGMLVGTVGLAPLILLQAESHAFASFANISLPELVLIGAMTSACYAWFVVRALMRRGYGITLINGIAMGIGGLFCIPTVMYAEPNAVAHVTSWSSFIGWLSVLIFLSHIVSYNLYSYLLSRYSITFMTFCGFLCPLFSTLFGAIWLGEVITWHYGAALAGITVGLVIFSRGKVKAL